MINLPFYKVLNLEIPTHIKYWIIKNKQIPKHLLEIIDQTPPITLENTLELPLENFKIHGRTTQTQLTGKNKCDGIFEQGSISSSGADTLADNRIRLKNYAEVSPSTTYTFKTNSTYSLQVYVFEYDENKDFIQRIPSTWIELPYTFATSVTTKYIRVICAKDNTENISPSDVYNTQLELGATATDYESYCGGQPSPNPEFPQPINNVSGDITISVSDENNTNSQEVVFPLAEGQKLMEGDYLAEDGIHHVRYRYEITGEETITKASAPSNPLGFYYIVSIPVNAKYDDKTTVANLLSNYFSRVSNNIIFIGKGTMTVSSTKNKVAFNIDENYTTKEQVAEFFRQLYENNTPVIIEYNLETETIDPYTEAQQEAYNNFKNLHGYNNITIVNATSNDLPPNVSLKYYAKGW